MQVFTPSSHPPDRYYDTVLVLRDAQEAEKQTEGGLFIPGRAVELANQGEVRAVSANSQYEVGQRIVFTKYAGSEIPLNGVDYLLLQEREIQGTVTEVANTTETIADKEESARLLQAALAQFERTKQG